MTHRPGCTCPASAGEHQPTCHLMVPNHSPSWTCASHVCSCGTDQPQAPGPSGFVAPCRVAAGSSETTASADDGQPRPDVAREAEVTEQAKDYAAAIINVVERFETDARQVHEVAILIQTLVTTAEARGAERMREEAKQLVRSAMGNDLEDDSHCSECALAHRILRGLNAALRTAPGAGT